MLFSHFFLLFTLLACIFSLAKTQSETDCGQGRYCPSGFRCCHYNTCCNESYYYTSWWFWLIWVLLIFISTCCYYYRRRRLNNDYIARRRHCLRNRTIVTSSSSRDDEEEDVESATGTGERLPNSVVPLTAEEVELFKDLPPEYAATVGPPPSYVDVVEEREPPPQYTEE
ncbi:WW domain binding protein 1-like [Oscarella lobularis]|uniref:WW domain binding protein 1-like n=1 Tax=Oscarella lobularis TaxID=121494 RepID=UPI0033138F46